MKTRYSGITVNPNRHGKLRARFRKLGRKQYMKHLPDQPGFEEAYDAWLARKPQPQPRHFHGSVDHLCLLYYKSADFQD